MLITPDKRSAVWGSTNAPSNSVSERRDPQPANTPRHTECSLGPTPSPSQRLEETPPQTLKPEVPRFRFPQGSRCTIYNLPVLSRLREAEPLWIAEGASDCWALLSAGHKAIAIPSATLLKPDDLALLETLNLKLGTPFHMAPDQDLPGERLFLQLRGRLPNLTRHQLPPGCKDYADYYVKYKV